MRPSIVFSPCRLASFRHFLASYQSLGYARSRTLMKGCGSSLLNPDRQISSHDVPFYVDSKRRFVKAIIS